MNLNTIVTLGARLPDGQEVPFAFFNRTQLKHFLRVTSFDFARLD